MLDPVAAWYVSDILADVPPPINGSPGRIAYKTGTSYGYRDAWAVGYDGKTVIGVWVGRPDGAPVPGIAGITAAAPILFEAFDRMATPWWRHFASASAGRARSPSNSQLPAPLKLASAIRMQDLVAKERGTRDRLPGRWRRPRPRRRRRRRGATDRQDPERRSTLHLLRQRRADRPIRLRPPGKLAAGRSRFRHHLGGRRAKGRSDKVKVFID